MRHIGKTSFLVAVVALFVQMNAAHGTRTVCSHPKRAGVRAVATIPLPWSKVTELHEWLEASSETNLGMSFSSVGVADGPNLPLKEQTIILQSPKVSVNIEITAKSGNSVAKVVVNRTCYNDDLEPWLPYWHRFRTALRLHGYVLKP